MNNGFYSDRYNGKGIQAGKRRAKVAALKAEIEAGKVPKIDPVATAKTMFRAAANFFLRRSANRSRGQRG